MQNYFQVWTTMYDRWLCNTSLYVELKYVCPDKTMPRSVTQRIGMHVCAVLNIKVINTDHKNQWSWQMTIYCYWKILILTNKDSEAVNNNKDLADFQWDRKRLGVSKYHTNKNVYFHLGLYRGKFWKKIFLIHEEQFRPKLRL